MKKHLIAYCFIVVIIVIFFHKTLFSGLVPFPGDVLLSEYQPWRSYSYMGYNPGSIPNKAQYPDTLRQLYPWKTIVVEALRNHRLPLWNPYNFSGTPILANFQSAVLYPLNIVYLTLSQIDAWTVLVIIQPLLTILGVFLYSRVLGLSLLASLFAGVSFGFSSYASVWLEYNTVGHIICWLPFMLLSLEKMKTKQFHPVWLAILGSTQTLSLLAGHPQVYAYVLAFVLCYTVFRIRETQKRILAAISLLLGIGMASVQLIPGFELIRLSARSPHETSNLFTKILIQPAQTLMAVFPNIFGNPATRTYWPQDTYVGKVLSIGLVPLFFLLSALRRHKEPIVKFYIFSALVVLMLITANPITYLLYKVNIPLISTSSPTLMSFLFALSLSMLTAYGIDGWRSEKHSVSKLVKRGVQVCIALGIITALWHIIPPFSEHTALAVKSIAYAGILTLAILVTFTFAILRPKLMVAAITLLLCVHTVDLFIAFQRFNPFVPKEYVYPPAAVAEKLSQFTPYRFWSHGSAVIDANLATQLSLYSTDGYDPLYPKWYGEFIHSSSDGTIPISFTNQTRSDAFVARSSYGNEIMNNPYRIRVLDMLGVKYILDRAENASSEKTFPLDRFTLIYNEDNWRIYENRRAAPRAFLTQSYEVYTDAQNFTDRFYADTFDPSSMVLLSKKPKNIHVSGEPLDADVRITSYTPNLVDITTFATQSGILFLSDTYYPGWNASIDGVPAAILRANWAFRAVEVPSGTHHVLFRYKPGLLQTGIILSSICSAGILVICIISSNRKKRT